MPQEPDRTSIYQDLRNQFLRLPPPPRGDSALIPDVYGAVVDFHIGAGLVTTVAHVDGTSSLYFSTGGGVLGFGNHPGVRAASAELLRLLSRDVGLMVRTSNIGLPSPGMTDIRALAASGLLLARAPSSEFDTQRHPLWPAFKVAMAITMQLQAIVHPDSPGMTPPPA